MVTQPGEAAVPGTCLMPQEPGEVSGRQDPGLFPRLGVSRGGAGAAGLSFLKESLLPRVKVPVGSLLG